MLTSKTMKSLLMQVMRVNSRSQRCFSSSTGEAPPPKFGDFTQKIDEEAMKAPIISENEIKFDSKY
jgi:hypothetical protein